MPLHHDDVFPPGTTGLPAGWDPEYWQPVYRDGRFRGAYAPDGAYVPVATEIHWPDET